MGGDNAKSHVLKTDAQQSGVAVLVATGAAMAIDGGVSLGNFADKLLLMGMPTLVGAIAINGLADQFLDPSKFGSSKYYPYRAALGGAAAVGFMMLIGAAPVELSMGNVLAGGISAVSIAAGDYLINGM